MLVQALRAAGSTSKGGDPESQQLQCEWKGLRKKTDCDKGNLEVTLSSMETFPLSIGLTGVMEQWRRKLTGYQSNLESVAFQSSS